MRRPVSGILVLFLLFALLFVQKASVPLANGSSSVYQGDLILTGNNVTVIEGRFDINGSIVVQDNATLILKNAFLNFTQIEEYQHYIWLNYPSNGNPRLLAYNSTITSTSDYALHIYCEANSTATINNCTCTCCDFWSAEYSVLSISNNSYVYYVQQYWFSIANINESTIRWFHNYDYSETKIYDSEIDSLLLYPESVNCTISQLKPELFSYWNFISNCSVTVQPGGSAPNVTLTNTSVNKWWFLFYGSSNATISNSAIECVRGMGSSVISLKSTTIYRVAPTDSSICLTNDSLITYVNAYASSTVWLLNSTYTGAYTQQSSKVYVSWYLNVHVKNSVDQNVPSASVTVTFPNATVADSKLTDANGWARFTLMEKMMNATGQYPIGNYTVKAEYGTYSSSTKANMTGNQEVTIQLPFGAPSPTPSPSPSPTPSSSPTPSPAPTPTPSSSPDPTTAPTPTPEPTPSLFLPIEALFGIGAIITIAIILIVFISLRKRKLD